jgi:hypothetical protein
LWNSFGGRDLGTIQRPQELTHHEATMPDWVLFVGAVLSLIVIIYTVYHSLR